MPLRPEQKQAYLAGGGCVCPFCGGTTPEGGFVEVTQHGAEQPITCPDCSARWHDVHRRVDIVVEEDTAHGDLP